MAADSNQPYSLVMAADAEAALKSAINITNRDSKFFFI
jgi:hypothetical protein